MIKQSQPPLDPLLVDLREIIESRQFDTNGGKVTCAAIAVGDSAALQVTDTQNGEMIFTAEITERSDYLLVLPLTPNLPCADSSLPDFRIYLASLCSDEKMIFIEHEDDGCTERQTGNASFAVGVRFRWVTSKTDLAKSFEHNLALLNRFYVKHADDIMKKFIDSEFQMPE